MLDTSGSIGSGLLIIIAFYFLPSYLFWTMFLTGFFWLWFFASSGMSIRQKVAIATWAPMQDGRLHVKCSVDVTAAQQYIEVLRQRTGEHVTLTHLLGMPCSQV